MYGLGGGLATDSTTVRYVEVVQKLCFADLPTHTPVSYKIFRLMPPFNGVFLAMSILHVLSTSTSMHVAKNSCCEALVGCVF